MSRTLSNRLIESARLAAASGKEVAAADCHAALQLGAQSVRLGWRLPLFVLIDWVTIVRTSSARLLLPHPQRQQSSATRAYDSWVGQLSEQVHERLGRELNFHISDDHEWERTAEQLLPVLLHSIDSVVTAQQGEVWNCPLSEWLSAWTGLSADRVQEHWASTTRQTDELEWNDWWNVSALEDRVPEITVISCLQALLNVARPDEAAWTTEAFDFGAATLFVEAEDVDPLPDQQSRIEQLRRRVRETISLPVATAVSQEDRFGVRTLYPLLLEEYGEFLMTNEMDPRFNDPPVTLPPTPVEIHLCWACGSAAWRQIERQLPAAQQDTKQEADENPGTTDPESHQPAQRICLTSLLAGLTALILDDWRNALYRVPVKFSLHQFAPRRGQCKIGKPGPRWKRALVDGFGPLIPSNVVSLTMHRNDAVTTSQSGLHQLAEPSVPENLSDRPTHWWLAVILLGDLEALGFGRTSASIGGRRETGWNGDDTTKRFVGIDHILVFHPRASDSAGGKQHSGRKSGDLNRMTASSSTTDSKSTARSRPFSDGTICRVEYSHGRCWLVPEPQISVATTDEESSFFSLRIRAIDVLLNELQRRFP